VVLAGFHMPGTRVMGMSAEKLVHTNAKVWVVLDEHENSSEENSNQEPGREPGCIYTIED
jgi:hypothetical protein